MSTPEWTPEESALADKAINALKRDLRRVEDLLTDEERKSLQADLAEMARIRRRAMGESANWIMP